MKRLIATAVAGLGIGFSAGQVVDVPTSAVEYTYYDLDSGRNVQPPVSTEGYRDDSLAVDFLLHTYPLDKYVYHVNGDNNYDGKVNVVDQVNLVQYLWHGRPLPVKPAN